MILAKASTVVPYLSAIWLRVSPASTRWLLTAVGVLVGTGVLVGAMVAVKVTVGEGARVGVKVGFGVLVERGRVSLSPSVPPSALNIR